MRLMSCSGAKDMAAPSRRPDRTAVPDTKNPHANIYIYIYIYIYILFYLFIYVYKTKDIWVEIFSESPLLLRYGKRKHNKVI